MDDESPNSPRGRRHTGTTNVPTDAAPLDHPISIHLSPQEVAALAHIAAQSASQHQGSTRQSYESLANILQSAQTAHPPAPPFPAGYQFTPPLPFPSPIVPVIQPFLHPSQNQFSQGGQPSLGPPLAPHELLLSAAPAQGSPQVAGPSSSANSPAHELTEADELTMAEEKRRRNTAASARFRIKKKQRTLNLERTISDLAGRADELEKEAEELRRENGWLKEIVMLKQAKLVSTALDASQTDEAHAADDDSDSEEHYKSKGK